MSGGQGPGAAPRAVWWAEGWALHRRWAGLATLAVLAAVVLWGAPSPTARLGLLVTGVALFGVPHGALDPLPGRDLLARTWGGWWPVVFTVGYLALAAVVILVWWFSPAAWLVGFLLVAAGHFGEGDVEQELAPPGWRGVQVGYLAEVVLRGALPVVLPLACHPEIATALFGALLPGADRATTGVVTASRWLAAGLVPGLALLALWHLAAGRRTRDDAHRVAHRWVVVEILTLGLLFWLAPPLLAFLVYFCLWHSGRHALELAALLDPRDGRRGLARFAVLAVPLTVATVVLGAAAYLWARGAGWAADAAVLRVVFVGLAALTVPHVALHAGLHRAADPAVPDSP